MDGRDVTRGKYDLVVRVYAGEVAVIPVAFVEPFGVRDSGPAGPKEVASVGYLGSGVVSRAGGLESSSGFLARGRPALGRGVAAEQGGDEQAERTQPHVELRCREYVLQRQVCGCLMYVCTQKQYSDMHGHGNSVYERLTLTA